MDTNNKSIIQQLLEIADSVVIEPSEDLEEGKKKGKKKPYDSVTYTTGDLQKNIDHFNKCLTGKANNDNSKGPLPDYVFAKGADGSSSIPSSAATSGEGASAGTSAGGEGGGMGESLEINEAKRYVRRYYMRPQDIFCSNKAEILKALIDHQDENCVIYTLNNLGDNKDVHKLTEADIIYFYEDGILYDKNHVRIMDYDLYIKHEEERDNINPETTSDAKFQDVYDDRMTDQTVVEELNEAITDFATLEKKKDFNAKWVKSLKYGSKDGKINSIIGAEVKVTRFSRIPGKRNRTSKELTATIKDVFLGKDTGEIYLVLDNKGTNLQFKLNDFFQEGVSKKDPNVSFKLTTNDSILNQRLGIYKMDRKSAIYGLGNKGADVIKDLDDLEKEEAKNWLLENLDRINFIILYPDTWVLTNGETISKEKWNQLSAKFMRAYNEFCSSFPTARNIRVGDNKDIGKNINVSIKRTSENPEPYVEGYDLAGKEADVYFKVPYSQVPEVIKNMILDAKTVGYSQNKGATEPKPGDKKIISFPLAMAILELFNYDLDFLDEKADLKSKEEDKVEEAFNLKFESVDIHGFKLREAREEVTKAEFFDCLYNEYFMGDEDEDEIKECKARLQKEFSRPNRDDYGGSCTFETSYKPLKTDSPLEESLLTENAHYVDSYKGYDIYWEEDGKHAGEYWCQKGYTDQCWDMYFNSKSELKAYIDKNGNSSYDYDEFEEAFGLTFPTAETLTEAKHEEVCCICGEEIEGYGNNAEPYKKGKCCDACNLKFVIPARIVQLEKDKE